MNTSVRLNLMLSCIAFMASLSVGTSTNAQTCGHEPNVKRVCHSGCCCAQCQREVTVYVKSDDACCSKRGFFQNRPLINVSAPTAAPTSVVSPTVVQSVPVIYTTAMGMQPMMMGFPTGLMLAGSGQANQTSAQSYNAVTSSNSTTSDVRELTKRIEDLAVEVKSMGEDLDKLIDVVDRHDQLLRKMHDGGQ